MTLVTLVVLLTFFQTLVFVPAVCQGKIPDIQQQETLKPWGLLNRSNKGSLSSSETGFITFPNHKLK